jgi:hypothetical protein
MLTGEDLEVIRFNTEQLIQEFDEPRRAPRQE